MRQSLATLLRHLPYQIRRYFGVLREGTSIFVISSVREGGDMIANRDTGDLTSDFGDIAREVTATDSADIGYFVNIYQRVGIGLDEIMRTREIVSASAERTLPVRGVQCNGDDFNKNLIVVDCGNRDVLYICYTLCFGNQRFHCRWERHASLMR